MTDLDKCPTCGGPADNGNDREVPLNPYECVRCTAEKKHLYVEFQDGTLWKIPVHIIASSRAQYYSDREPEDNIFAEEYEYTLSDDYEILDWADNNMNWENVEDYATQVQTPAPSLDYDKWWLNSKKYIA